jgi:hypothetical protein
MESVVAQLAGETLESYCRGDRCPLYFTKQQAIPMEFLALLDAANRLRERRLAGRLPSLRTLEAWKWEAYLTTEYARRLVQQEQAEEDAAEAESQTGSQDKGKRKMEPVRTTMRQQMERSDSGAFAIQQPAEQEADAVMETEG